MLESDRDICSSVKSRDTESAAQVIMQRFQQFLLQIWREVCRHIEIGESADRLRQMLADEMPVERLVIYRLDPNAKRAVIAADAPHPARGQVLVPNAEELPDRQRRRLMQWIRTGGVARAGEADAPTFPLPADFDPKIDFVAASLYGSHETFGWMLLAPRRGQRFNRQHEGMIAALQEPLAVALENDRRLQELNHLRERAETERSSLLLKLGRREMTDTVIGAETGLRLVMQRVKQISGSDVPVLILGATGTGKELVARAIHNGSPRSDGPFIRVNCGAIPAELIDSQLFGHEKGSFTGAVDTRPGWFERADGGTLFLDEIGELPLEAQVRFLRVLQDGYVERVGGHEPMHVNVRVVAATHRDLAAMVGEGKFREDLWYRIAVFPLLIPSLRDRKEDVPALVEHFAAKAATRFGLPSVTPTVADIELLQSYDWPGNIRELAAVIDRAAILGEGHTLEIAASLGSSGGGRIRERTPATGPAHRHPVAPSRIVPLNDAMRSHIEAALAATHGRIEGPTGAAALLRINPHTLRARMRKLKIDWNSFRALIPETAERPS